MLNGEEIALLTQGSEAHKLQQDQDHGNLQVWACEMLVLLSGTEQEMLTVV
jgi:hypothetical protein